MVSLISAGSSSSRAVMSLTRGVRGASNTHTTSRAQYRALYWCIILLVPSSRLHVSTSPRLQNGTFLNHTTLIRRPIDQHNLKLISPARLPISPPRLAPFTPHVNSQHHQPQLQPHRHQRHLSSTSRSSTSHFDTHLFVQRLQSQGLTRPQAEGVMTVLAEVVDESIKNMESGLVSKAEQEKVS